MSELTNVQKLVRSLRLRTEYHQPGVMAMDNTDHVSQDAADALEAQEARIKTLESLVEDGVALLEVIKEDWIDYDHIYSIHVHEAKQALSKAPSIK